MAFAKPNLSQKYILSLELLEYISGIKLIKK